MSTLSSSLIALIPRNSKFVAIVLEGATSDLADVVNAEEGVVFCPRAPFDIDLRWQQWIGTLRTKEFERANMVLLAYCPSEKPQEMDGESQELERTALRLWYSVLILGVPSYRGMNVISGGRVGEEFQVRQVSRLPTFYYNARSRPFVFSSDLAREAGYLFGVMKRIYEDPKKYRQLRRGLKSFERAISESLDYDRLHGFIRSLDAILMTEKGHGKVQFLKRCKLFIKPTSTTDSVLRVMYELRGRVEHQSDWDDLFPNADENARLHQANEITRQAEAVARTAYHIILRHENLLALFENTETIKAVWASSDYGGMLIPDEKKIDLSAISTPSMMIENDIKG